MADDDEYLQRNDEAYGGVEQAQKWKEATEKQQQKTNDSSN